MKAVEYNVDDPEEVSNNLGNAINDFYDYERGYWEPPLSFNGLKSTIRINPTFGSAIFLKRNALVLTFKQVRHLTRKTMEALVLDYLNIGNCYLLKVRSKLGNVVEYRHLHAHVMRKAKNGGYIKLSAPNNQNIEDADTFSNEVEQVVIPKEDIIHIKEYAPESKHYGLPEAISLLNTIFLGNEATVFRRRFYKNGAHTGYIFEIDEGSIDKKEKEYYKELLSGTKGVGNFKSNVIFSKTKSNAIGDKKNGKEVLKIHPMGDIKSQDEFQRIKDVELKEIIIATRSPIVLMGGNPESGSHLGDASKLMEAWGYNEIKPLQRDLMDEINPELEKDGFDPIEFEDYGLKVN
jgi:PBSX family phage portal protein